MEGLRSRHDLCALCSQTTLICLLLVAVIIFILDRKEKVGSLWHFGFLFSAQCHPIYSFVDMKQCWKTRRMVAQCVRKESGDLGVEAGEASS